MEFLKKTQKFNFLYDGKNFREYEYQKEIKEDGNTLTETYIFDDGLKVINIAKKYSDCDAYEWVTWYENTGDEPTKILSDIKDSDSNFFFEKDPEYDWGSAVRPDCDKALRVYNPTGSHNNETDFQVYMDTNQHGRCFYHLYDHDEYYYKPVGGRSSNGEDAHMNGFDLRTCTTEGSAPFFNLNRQGKGIIFAVGWSGQWNVRIYRDGEYVNVQSKIEDTSFVLMPGEKIRTSSFVVMNYECDFIESQNKWRRFVKKYFSVLGKQNRDKLCPFSLFTWGGWSTDRVMKLIDKKKKNHLPFDYVWMDAGWYGADAPHSDNDAEGIWGQYAGDWRVNTKIHPNGLKDVAKAITDAGMKFLLWFETERVTKLAPVVKEHPEFLLPFPNTEDNYLLNLGDENAFDFAYEVLCERIDELNIKCVRQDFNINPLDAWRNNDDENRRGITEIKYINGLYKLFDNLLEKYPDIIIDNCASGGRRIDIEMYKRSVPLWRSDYMCPANYPVKANQIHNMAYSLWLPYSGTSVGAESTDIYRARSAYAAGINMMVTEDMAADIKKIGEEYQRARQFFSEDFYPLTAYSSNEDCWCGWQYNRPEENDGLIQVFKRANSAYMSAVYKLRGLDKNKRYIIEDADDGSTKTVSGRELAENGFEVKIKNARTAKLYFYKEEV